MKAIILAAGEGIRMRPLTTKTPKPLIKVLNKPLIQHLIETFPPQIKEIILVIGYLGDQIKDFCGDKFLSRPIIYLWQKEKTGTYGALKLTEPLLKNEESFFVFYADDLISQNTILNCLKHPLAVSVQKVADPSRFGIAVINPDGSIKEIEEKPKNPKSNLALASGYLLNKKIFNYPVAPQTSGEYHLPDALNKMAKDYKIMTVLVDFWLPLAAPEDIQKAEMTLKKLYPV